MPTTTTLQHEPNGVLCFNTPIGSDQVTAFVSDNAPSLTITLKL